MPRYDRTGPIGAGPRTGRGLGRCGGDAAEGLRTSQRVFGRRGRCFGGRGGGMGLGGRSITGDAFQSSLEEAEALRSQLEDAEAEIAAIKVRLEELAKG